MATATIINAWYQNGVAFLAVGVQSEAEDGGTQEYVGTTPLRKADGTLKTAIELKADLVASCKAARARFLAIQRGTLSYTGTVEL